MDVILKVRSEIKMNKKQLLKTFMVCKITHSTHAHRPFQSNHILINESKFPCFEQAVHTTFHSQMKISLLNVPINLSNSNVPIGSTTYLSKTFTRHNWNSPNQLFPNSSIVSTMAQPKRQDNANPMITDIVSVSTSCTNLC